MSQEIEALKLWMLYARERENKIPDLGLRVRYYEDAKRLTNEVLSQQEGL